MLPTPIVNSANEAEASRLDALLKRVVSGELALPSHAHGLALGAQRDFGALDPDMSSVASQSRPATLRNSSPNPITITRIDLLPAAEVFEVYSDASLRCPVQLPAVIPAGGTFPFSLCLRATAYPGKLSSRLVVSAVMQLESVALEQAWCSFIIGCVCSAVIRNPLVSAAADVEAKAFVPAAIRSIFDHMTETYPAPAPPPQCAATCQSVCCFCHEQTLSAPKRKLPREKTYRKNSPHVPASKPEQSALLALLAAPNSPLIYGARQTEGFGSAGHRAKCCECSYHDICLHRWAIITSEEFPFLLPCPACGFTILQLPAVISKLPPDNADHEMSHHNLDISTSTRMQRTEAEIRAEVDRRISFSRHIKSMLDAAKAEHVARVQEMRGFTAFDVEFRVIETPHVGSAVLEHESAFLPGSSLLLLTLPGVPENSPKLHLHQMLRLRFSCFGVAQSPETMCGAEFTCRVVRVRGSEVIVDCPPAIEAACYYNHTQPLNLHVSFCVDFTDIAQEFRLLIFGLDSKSIAPLLLPEVTEASCLSAAPAVGIFDARLSAEQLDCVSCALQSVRDGADVSPAHIICGPPGTGKTAVLSEIILQVWQLHQQEGSGVILVTAPSHDAADVLALRLRQHLSPQELLLVCSTRRSVDTLRPGLHDYANIVATQHAGIPLDFFVMPSIEALHSHSIIVASCGACAELSVMIAEAGKQAELHVSLIVVDEAAQATEVEALKALSFVGMRTRVLLAGDHMQLGPVIASRRAQELRLQVSLMQRLVESAVYRQPGLCSRLSVNYRCHPALIAVPSFLFYCNSIRCAPPPPPHAHDIGRQLSEWPGLPRRDFPLMFYGVAGIDSSPDGHGVQNAVEAKSLLFLVSKLLQDMPWLKQSDIGVMATFRLQVSQARLPLRFHRSSLIVRCGLCATCCVVPAFGT